MQVAAPGSSSGAGAGGAKDGAGGGSTPPDSPPGGSSDDGGGAESEVEYRAWDDEYWKQFDNPPDHPTPLPHNLSWANATSNASRGGPSTLEEAEHQLQLLFSPVMAFFTLLLLLALVGNILVIVVYRTRFRRNTDNFFVVFLAGLEMVIAAIGVPLEMVVLARPLTLNGAACKVARYVETVSVCALLLALTAMAVDRYCKHTRPPKFLQLRWAKGLCVGALLLALVLSLPALALFGSQTVETAAPNITGVACGVDDSVAAAASNPFRLMYVSPLWLTVVGTLGVMAGLYVSVFVKIGRKKSAARGERVSPARRDYPRKHRFVTEDSTSSCGGGERGSGGGGGGGRLGGGGGGEETRKFPTSSSSSSSGGGGGCRGGGGDRDGTRSGRTSPGFDPARVPLKPAVKESARIGRGASNKVDVPSDHMTWIVFVASVLAAVSVAPYAILRTLQALTPLLHRVHPPILQAFVELFARLYLLHPAIMPLLYLLCNCNFRREVKYLWQRACRGCKPKGGKGQGAPSSGSSSSGPGGRNSHNSHS